MQRKIKNILALLIVMISIIGFIGGAKAATYERNISTADFYDRENPGDLMKNKGYDYTIFSAQGLLADKYRELAPVGIPTEDNIVVSTDSGYEAEIVDSQEFHRRLNITDSLSGKTVIIKNLKEGTTKFNNTYVIFKQLYKIGGQYLDAKVTLDKIVTNMDNRVALIYVNQTGNHSPYLGYAQQKASTAGSTAWFNIPGALNGKYLAYQSTHVTVELFYSGTTTPYSNSKLVSFINDIDGEYYDFASIKNVDKSNIYLPSTDSKLYIDSKGFISSSEVDDVNGGYKTEACQRISCIVANDQTLTKNGKISVSHGWVKDLQEANNGALEPNLEKATGVSTMGSQTDIEFLAPILYTTYRTDEGGIIDNVKPNANKTTDGGPSNNEFDETLLNGDSPSGANHTIKEGYCIIGWKATQNDKEIDVYLGNTKVDAGTYLTDAEVEAVVLSGNETNTVFTLYHEKCPDPTKTYASTSKVKQEGQNVKVGDIIEYEIIWSNGTGKTADIKIEDTLTTLEFVKITEGDVTPQVSKDKKSFTIIIPEQKAGSQGKIKYQARVINDGGKIAKNNVKITVGEKIYTKSLQNPLSTSIIVPNTASTVSKIAMIVGALLVCGGALIFVNKYYKKN